jgi:hypothetical protein
LAVSYGHNSRGQFDQLVPGIAATIGDLIIGFEDAVGEPVVPHELPDIFDWIELRTFGRYRYDADILGYDKRIGHVPPGLIHEHYGKGTRCYCT